MIDFLLESIIIIIAIIADILYVQWQKQQLQKK